MLKKIMNGRNAVIAAGYGAYILSNYPKELSETHWPKFRFLPEADGYIISALEKLAKPDPAIFRNNMGSL